MIRRACAFMHNQYNLRLAEADSLNKNWFNEMIVRMSWAMEIITNWLGKL